MEGEVGPQIMGQVGISSRVQTAFLDVRNSIIACPKIRVQKVPWSSGETLFVRVVGEGGMDG